MAETTTVAVLLAAGAGTRFRDAGHKLLAPLPAHADEPAEPVFARALRHALAADIGPVVVVTGAVFLDLPADVVTRHNPDWSDGQMTSVHAGLDAARALGATAAVIGLADQPGVSGDAWRRIAAATGPIAVASYDGVRGNPVRLAAEVWDLLPATGDEGARALMRLRPDLVGEVPCTGSSADIDTVEDLRRWQSN
jgi:CTP:molybdopterin cytidylyltransferase MocA